MRTVSFTMPLVEGMCQVDQYADARKHASMDLNGEWFGNYRATRRGSRLLLGTEGIFDFKAVRLFESTVSKELRALVVAHVICDDYDGIAVQIPYANDSGANLVTFYPHEIALLVLRVSDGKLLGWGRPYSDERPQNEVPEPGHTDSTGMSYPSGIFYHPWREAPGPWHARLVEHRDIFYLYGFGQYVWKVWKYQIADETIEHGTIGGETWAWDLNETGIPATFPATGMPYRFGQFAVRRCEFERGLAVTAYAFLLAGIRARYAAVQHDSIVWILDDDYVNISGGGVDKDDELVPRPSIVSTDTTTDLVTGVKVDETVAWMSDPRSPMSIAWVSQYTHDTGGRIVAVASLGTRFAIIGEKKTKIVSDLSATSFVDPTLEFGTCAPWSVQSFDDRCVFVSHEGIVVLAAGGGKVQSAPFLDPLFEGSSKATVPRQKFREGRRLGLPYSVDHDRLSLAVSTHDRRNTTYTVAVSTVGSPVPNDLLIIWNYGAGRWHLHHGTETISEGMWYGYMTESHRADTDWEIGDQRFRATVVKASDDDLKNYVSAVRQAYDGAEWGDVQLDLDLPLSTTLWWRDADTYSANSDGVTVFVNATGVYAAWSGDEERIAADYGLVGEALFGTYIPRPVLFPSCILSVRSTPMIGVGDFALKNVQGVRLTLAEPIYKSCGASAVYVETEHGSTECLSVEADAPERFRTHETAGDSDAMQSEPDRPRWGQADEEWGSPAEGGTGRKWYRPDAVSIRIDTNVPDSGWMRATVFDALGTVDADKVGLKRELKLVNLGLEVAVDRPSDQAW